MDYEMKYDGMNIEKGWLVEVFGKQGIVARGGRGRRIKVVFDGNRAMMVSVEDVKIVSRNKFGLLGKY
jgi:hypothetical protein